MEDLKFGETKQHDQKTNCNATNCKIRWTSSIVEPEVLGMIKFSHDDADLPQEMAIMTAIPCLFINLKSLSIGQITVAGNIVCFYSLLETRHTIRSLQLMEILCSNAYAQTKNLNYTF